MKRKTIEEILQRGKEYKKQYEAKIDAHVAEFNRIMSQEEASRRLVLLEALFQHLRYDLEQDTEAGKHIALGEQLLSEATDAPAPLTDPATPSDQ